MLEDIPSQGPIIQFHIIDILLDWVLKGLPLLYLTLWLLRDVCCTDEGSVPESIRQWQEQLECLQQSLPAILERMGQLVCSRGCTRQYHFCP